MKKYKILISGYYGFNNIGDESILKAVVENLREKLRDIEITVLSANPEDTASRYGVRAVNRKSLRIVPAIAGSDLLISGGGSLLQDVTSSRSLKYYLYIIRTALLFGKDVFIYSQGIGPINDEKNRRAVAGVLKKVSGIAVRDENSKLFLMDLGLPPEAVTVTADPVLRLPPMGTEEGARLLRDEGFIHDETKRLIGFAVKEKRPDSAFMDELFKSMKALLSEGNCEIVLIPFHFSEDIMPCSELERRLREAGYGKEAVCLKHKYLTDEMMSIIGNMDMLCGVRLHSLIHAAIMSVPIIGISYDPKVNSFLNSIDQKALSFTEDFKAKYFMEEYERVWKCRDEIKARMSERLRELVESLDKNEKMIEEIRNGKA